MITGGDAFDVVVVGAVAGGCVAAARLAKTTTRSVLVLEAGPDLRSDIPTGLTDGWGLNRDFYWSIQSAPDELGARASVPCCSLVGGTSWMTRFAVRSSPADFDEWVDLGNPGCRPFLSVPTKETGHGDLNEPRCKGAVDAAVDESLR